MARARRTQKQIAERYKSNLGYYNKLHPWRRTRRLVTLLSIFAGLAGVWAYQRWGRETFFNSGEISSHHAAFGDDCAKCHDKSVVSDGALTPKKFTAVLKERFRSGITAERIDRKCEACHAQHNFHEPNVVDNRSCSACHQEHEGPGPMKLVASSSCTSCHGNGQIMAAAAEKGPQLSPDAFHRHPHPSNQNVFELPRPPQGFTQIIDSFAGNHPEFQLAVSQARDPDVLRFNHRRHFAPDIPLVNGRQLDCNYCHKPHADGRYYQRINFAANCQACHSLQFDPRNPDLKIPHGDVALARAFLRSLPAQYADHARLKKGITREADVSNFVAQQLRQLREQFRTGDELEQAVFFTSDPYKHQRQNAPGSRASFIGCAFCHEVKPVRNGPPSITKPIPIDRWMLRANFNHAKHDSIRCDDCHRANQSKDTTDVLMPVKANCTTCHSPAGKVTSECITCHTYHGPPAAQITVAEARNFPPVSTKQMMLGQR